MPEADRHPVVVPKTVSQVVQNLPQILVLDVALGRAPASLSPLLDVLRDGVDEISRVRFDDDMLDSAGLGAVPHAYRCRYT